MASSQNPDANGADGPGEPTNWGRWGADDQRGAVNLIDDAKRLEAARLVKSGTIVSLSRDVTTGPNPTDFFFAQQFVQQHDGVAIDFFHTPIHTHSNTHLDALNHTWDVHGMWNGRDPESAFAGNRMTWADVSAWGDGIVTRGLLFDVPAYRGVDYVTIEEPVRGRELEAIAKAKGLEPTPGDALVVYCGRENWERDHGSYYLLDVPSMTREPSSFYTGLKRPGLSVSCLEYVRKADCALLMWDMLDAYPNDVEEAQALGYQVVRPEYSPWWRTAWAYGIAVVDQARLDRLAEACRRLGRWEFMVAVAPLRISGGTGSPVNPLAIL
jgi:kynurenine formamidase